MWPQTFADTYQPHHQGHNFHSENRIREGQAVAHVEAASHAVALRVALAVREEPQVAPGDDAPVDAVPAVVAAHGAVAPGGSVRGEQAHFTRLVLGAVRCGYRIN